MSSLTTGVAFHEVSDVVVLMTCADDISKSMKFRMEKEEAISLAQKLLDAAGKITEEDAEDA